MPIVKIVTGEEYSEFNGPLLGPIWDGEDGLRHGQTSYDADGVIDPSVGPSPIWWDGTQWNIFSSGAAVVWDTNNGFPVARILPANGSTPSTIVHVYDQYTRTVITYSQSTTKIGGGAITDGDLGPIYIKNPATGIYYVRNWEGPVYPRWWGAVADGSTADSAAWTAAIAFAAPLSMVIDGEGKSYKIGGITMLEKSIIKNARFVLTAGTHGLKINEIGQAPTVYKRRLYLENITFTGSCTYALIISTITGIYINGLFFEGLTCANDVFYLLNIYDSEVRNIRFTGCTAGSGGSCLNMPAGINGMNISNVYTSAFTDFGINIAGGSAIFLSNCTIQGATTGMYFSACLGVTVETPYFENTVNPVVIDNVVSDPGSIRFHGGTWFAPYPSHPQLGQNNGVYLKYTGGRNGISIFGGAFDVGASSGKKLASVGSSGVVNIFRPHLITGSNTPEVTDYLFKESTALSSAGFYVEYTRTANAYTTVRRNSANGNQHIVETLESGSNLLRSLWSPSNVGGAAVALSFYQARVSAIKTSSYTLTTSDDTVRFNVTSNLIATLPVSNVPTGKVFVIKKTGGTFNLSIVTSGGVVTIDGVLSYTLSGISETVTVQWDGTNYIIIGRDNSFSRIVSAAVIIEDIITNAYMNANYSDIPGGGMVIFDNLTGYSGNTAIVIKTSATTWSNRIDFIKNT